MQKHKLLFGCTAGVLGMFLLLSAAWAAKPSADDSCKTLKACLAELQDAPGDRELREKIIKLALKRKTAPAVPEEAERRLARGRAAVKAAEGKEGFQRAVQEFQKATLAAPWLAEAYYNLGIVQDKAGDYTKAIQSLRLYLLAAPYAEDARAVKSLIYEIEFREEEAEKACGTATITDADGNTYKTVQIGEQCWMAENLNVGTMLASARTTPSNNGTVQKWCYDNNSNICATEGGLYNWNEAMGYVTTEGAQGICPSGWHIPTDAEWCTLTQYVDSSVDCGVSGGSGTDCGTKLKQDGSSGFGALLAGFRNTDGSYVSRGAYANLWSSSPSGGDAWLRYLYVSGADVYRNTSDEALGFSVRCLKD